MPTTSMTMPMPENGMFISKRKRDEFENREDELNSDIENQLKSDDVYTRPEPLWVHVVGRQNAFIGTDYSAK